MGDAMTHDTLFLVTTNDRKLVGKAFEHSGLRVEDLSAPAAGSFGAAVFASSAEVLFIRRPVEAGQRLDTLLDEQLRTHRVLAVSDATPGRPFVPHLTLPFRYKGWVFAAVGDTPPEEQPILSEREADFVTRNGGADSPTHRLMARIMFRVQRGSPATGDPEPRAIAQAIREAAELPGYERFTIAVTSEQAGVVVSQGRDVFYRTVTPRARGLFGHDEDLAAIDHLRATVVIDGVPMPRGDWNRVPDGQALLVPGVPPARLI